MLGYWVDFAATECVCRVYLFETTDYGGKLMFTSEQLDALQAAAEAEIREIHGAPGYLVSALGDIYSAGTNWRGYGARKLTPVAGKSGYPKVRLSVNGKRINRPVHRLVAEAFLPPPLLGAQVRHLDGNKLNNAAHNLAWGSAKENAVDRDRHGTTARGARNGFSKLSEQDVREIRSLRSAGLSYREIEAATGTHRMHARNIVERKVWTHVD